MLNHYQPFPAMISLLVHSKPLVISPVYSSKKKTFKKMRRKTFEKYQYQLT